MMLPLRQISDAPHGHILTNTAVWSPDGKWIVYDTRSDPAGSVFDGTHIERVHVESGRVEVLYESQHGACCGVATYHPMREQVVFILGPENPTPDWQYSACHRQGVLVSTNRPGEILNLDARNLTPPFTAGALRGGSHVHVFDGDGKLVSFTYEDHVLSQSPSPVLRGGARGGVGEAFVKKPCPNPSLKARGIDLNQRNIGISIMDMPVVVPKTHPRNHDGTAFSFLVTWTVNNPQIGTDEICRAYEDAWVGTHGYIRPDGSRQRYPLAFLGDVLVKPNKTITELFIVDLPDDITVAGDEPLEGTSTRRPAPPLGTEQRRITFTSHRKFPGIQGVRHWPRSSADGSRIAFLMRDDAGRAQIWTVSPHGTELRQVTAYPFDVASAFTWHPDAVHLTHIADGSVWIVNTNSGESTRLTAPDAGAAIPRPEACIFSPDGSQIAYVQPVVRGGATYNQIFVVTSGLD